MALGAKDIQSLLKRRSPLGAYAVFLVCAYGGGRTSCLAATTVFLCAHNTSLCSMVHTNYTFNTIRNYSVFCSTHRSLSVSNVSSCLLMLANAHTKDVCFCKPPPGGLIYMRVPDNSGWLKMRPNRRPFCNRHAFQMAFAIVCGPYKDPFRHSASEIPFRALPFPTKTRPLSSHDDFLRAQVVPFHPSRHCHQHFGHRFYAPMQAAP